MPSTLLKLLLPELATDRSLLPVLLPLLVAPPVPPPPLVQVQVPLLVLLPLLLVRAPLVLLLPPLVLVLLVQVPLLPRTAKPLLNKVRQAYYP
jgi:hypothetical protein